MMVIVMVICAIALFFIITAAIISVAPYLAVALIAVAVLLSLIRTK